MTKINTGGPAFPRPSAETSLGGNFEQEGIDLLDYTAIAAMQGLLAADRECEFKPKDLAECAYKIAVEMLVASEATKGEADA